MFTFSVVLFGKFQHSFHCQNVRGFVPVHPGLGFAHTIYATLQHKVSFSKTPLENRILMQNLAEFIVFLTHQGQHFANSLTRRFLQAIVAHKD